MDANNGGPAFPVNCLGDLSEGMTLRDYFAASAMYRCLTDDPKVTWSPTRVAEVAYAIADAMLKQRAKEK